MQLNIETAADDANDADADVGQVTQWLKLFLKRKKTNLEWFCVTNRVTINSFDSVGTGQLCFCNILLDRADVLFITLFSIRSK